MSENTVYKKGIKLSIMGKGAETLAIKTIKPFRNMNKNEN